MFNLFAKYLHCLTLFRVLLSLAAATEPYTCRLGLKAGSCQASHPRFFFNSQTHMCEEFIYSGCQGNENNFADWDDCISFCQEARGVKFLEPKKRHRNESSPDDLQICALPRDEGKCKGARPRFHYNSMTGYCEEFLFTMCGGNRNNFAHADHCVNHCGASGVRYIPSRNDFAHRSGRAFPMHSYCTESLAVGRCNGYMVRVWFNAATRTCQEFVFSGCQGNDNNFKSAAECMQMCPGLNVMRLQPGY